MSARACRRRRAVRTLSLDGNSSTEHWDGTAWSVVASPDPSLTLNFLTGVAVPKGGAAVAVGYRQETNRTQTLVLDERR
jgi:hypothetical protein